MYTNIIFYEIVTQGWTLNGSSPVVFYKGD